jgi:hypothetical protein
MHSTDRPDIHFELLNRSLKICKYLVRFTVGYKIAILFMSLEKLTPKWWVVVLITVIVGIIFISIYYTSPTPKSIFLEIVGSIGKSILGSGVFLLVLKSIQFLGVFKEEIRKIVYSEELLKKRSDIQEIWKKVTRAVYETAFPAISNKLEDLIQLKILPKKLNYYHKDVHVIYEIRKVNDNHFGLTESLSFIIVSDGGDFKFELTNDFAKTNLEDDLSEIKITQLTINDKEYANEITPGGFEDAGDNQVETKIIFNTNLEANTEYHVKKVTQTIHTNYLNGYWKYQFGRLTDSFTIDIRNPDNYELDLIPIGNNTSLQKVFVTSTLNLKKHYDLMVPGDGFLILIKPKTR